MRPLHCVILLLAPFAPHALAADVPKPKPNTLTPKEVAEGWILLFDGETTTGWEVEGEASVKDGVLIVGGARAAKASLATWLSSYYVAAEIDWDGKERPALRVGLLVTLARGRTRSEFARVETTASGKAAAGTSPVVVETPAGTSVRLQNVKARPKDLQPLFNATDLTGWKKYTADGKRVKTEFSVTEQGWLHLKNGPGDLQTEGRYDDFVLQLECRTNGKQLNSGVFFRCIPGDYQNGYEAQIHNGFDADKPKEYTVEEYDPKTNELKERKKVKSAATDYGTGAIYRRVPARRQAAKDNEWFTMTVAARGRHIATWVNGVQTVDWTDNRPLNDNPRNGCRLEKGGISLQGHDPTTDIDFRNIRIAEFPKRAK
jgi:hypothetical protein